MQFFSGSSVQFLLDIHDFGIGEMCKIRPLGNVFPYEFVGILNTPFLPRRVGIGKVHLYIFFPFHIQSFGNESVCSKLTAIVRGDGLYSTAIGKE